MEYNYVNPTQTQLRARARHQGAQSLEAKVRAQGLQALVQGTIIFTENF